MASFQKRHYQAIAAMIAEDSIERQNSRALVWDSAANIACKLADYFAADNPLFNRDTFAKACRGEDYRGKRRVA